MGLVLTRKPGEKIVIDNGKMLITVMKYKNGKIRLLFDCEPKIPIDRFEEFVKKPNVKWQGSVKISVTD